MRKICWFVLICLCACTPARAHEHWRYQRTVREPYTYETPPAQKDSFLAGASKIEITPPPSLGTVYLAGYAPGRPARGVHDTLWARCAAITDTKGQRVVFVGLDLIGFLHSDVEDTRKIVATFSDARLMIASTHTHSGPDTIGIWGATIFGIPVTTGRNENYMRFLKNQIVACVGDALEDQRPAQLFVSQKNIPALNRNLRESDVVDRTVTALTSKERGTEKTIFFLLNFGAHPEIMNTDLISADFVGTWYTEAEKEFGGVALFLNGALGAMGVPESPNIYTTHELPPAPSWQYGDANFGTEVEDVWSNKDWFAQRLHKKVLRSLQLEEITPQAITLKQETFAVPLENTQFWLAEKLGLLKRPDYIDGNITTEVGFLSLGPLGVAFLPGETPTALSFDVRQLLEAQHHYTMIVSLANDELGYLLNEEQYQSPLYDYERTMCVNPKIANTLLKHLARQLK